LSALSPVRSTSVTPFWPTWPPLLGSKLPPIRPPGAVPAGYPAAGAEPAGAVDVVVSAALAVPLSRAAPRAPPARVEPTRPALIRALRSVFMFSPCVGGPVFRTDTHTIGPQRPSSL